MDTYPSKTLRFLVLPIRPADGLRSPQVEAALACWRRVWEHARSAELNVAEPLDDSDFTKHDKVCMLLLDEQVIALLTLTGVDIADPTARPHAAVPTVWSAEYLDQVARRHPKVLVGSNVAVDFPYRSNSLGFSVKDALVGLTAEYVFKSEKLPLLGTVRRGKNMHSVAYRTGAECIVSDISYTIPGQYVDLVVWDKGCPAGELREMSERIDYDF